MANPLLTLNTIPSGRMAALTREPSRADAFAREFVFRHHLPYHMTDHLATAWLDGYVAGLEHAGDAMTRFFGEVKP